MTYKRERHFNKEMKMKNSWKLLSVVSILGALAITGCNLPVLFSSNTPTPITPLVSVTDLPTEEPNDLLQAGARDAALAYIKTTYPRYAPSDNLNWKVDEITPEGLVGSTTFQYSAEDWVITLTAPVVAPDAIIYHVEVTNESSPFRWEGEVDANGEVTEISTTGVGVNVVAWLGYVLSTPEGAQFDDYVVILPEGVGQFGIEGAQDAINAEIIALRDHEEPGKYAHFWGVLNCDVPDYGGCQLLVDQIRVGTEITEPEHIQNWFGRIYSLEPGMQFDDYFVLEGDYPVQYGISSFIAENGFPIYAEELESLRDTDQIINVSGELICGVPDSNGCQIQVSAIEVNGTTVDPYQGWLTYTNEDYSYQFRYPAEAEIHEAGVMGFPTEELPEGMSIDEYTAQLEEQYGERLCVSIGFSSGYIHISPPENESFKYAICGRTGVGAGELIDKTEQVFVAGGMATANGFEFISDNDTLPYHNETLVINLLDGTRIEYGARPTEGATYEDYLTEAKMVLLQILSTYETIE
jgi:hypothetical protein